MSDDKNFNRLTPAETERLALIAEECAEIIQVVGKILRHGYESCNPYDPMKETNRQLLQKEIGQLSYALILGRLSGDQDTVATDQACKTKSLTIERWLHHQDPDLLRRAESALNVLDDFETDVSGRD